MIVCPNCNHQNPDGAVQCEACYTPLPASVACPNCGASVQSDASFCGQCGFNLKAAHAKPQVPASPVGAEAPALPNPPQQSVAPALVMPDPTPIPESEELPVASELGSSSSDQDLAPDAIAVEASPVSQVKPSELTAPDGGRSPSQKLEGFTQLQQQTARLLHVQTNTELELPQNLVVIHLGKPNDRIPPDIDVSGFPSSEIVSRIHADIRIEGDAFYIEDVGSSNGTYINNLPLPIGNRHRLRSGDRIAFGKGDKVTFLFQLS